MISTLWVRPHMQSESSWLLLSTPSVFKLIGITSQFVYKLSNNQSRLKWRYSFKNFYCFYKVGSSELFGSYFYFIKPQWSCCFSPLVQAFPSIVGMSQPVLWPLDVPFCLFISASCPPFPLPPPTLRIRGTQWCFPGMTNYVQSWKSFDSDYLLHNAIHACRYLLIPFSSQYRIRFISLSLEHRK